MNQLMEEQRGSELMLGNDDIYECNRCHPSKLRQVLKSHIFQSRIKRRIVQVFHPGQAHLIEYVRREVNRQGSALSVAQLMRCRLLCAPLVLDEYSGVGAEVWYQRGDGRWPV